MKINITLILGFIFALSLSTIDAQNILSRAGIPLLQMRGTMMIDERGNYIGRLNSNRITNHRGIELGRVIDYRVISRNGMHLGFAFDNVITDPAGAVYIIIKNGRLKAPDNYHFATAHGMHANEIALWYFFAYRYSRFGFIL